MANGLMFWKAVLRLGTVSVVILHSPSPIFRLITHLSLLQMLLSSLIPGASTARSSASTLHGLIILCTLASSMVRRSRYALRHLIRPHQLGHRSCYLNRRTAGRPSGTRSMKVLRPCTMAGKRFYRTLLVTAGQRAMLSDCLLGMALAILRWPVVGRRQVHFWRVQMGTMGLDTMGKMKSSSVIDDPRSACVN